MVTQLLLLPLDGNKTWTLVEGLLAIGAGCQIELVLLLLLLLMVLLQAGQSKVGKLVLPVLLLLC